MNYARRALLCTVMLLTALFAACSYANLLEPGMCNRDQITGLKKNQRAPVYAGPGPGYLQVGELQNGDVVFSCDETPEWVNVLFSSTDGPCGEDVRERLRLGDGVPTERLWSCKSAWTAKKFTTFAASIPEPPRYPFRCNLARIDYLEDDIAVPIYAAPAVGHAQVGELKRGDIVYLCDGGRDFYNVYFSSPGGPCSVIADDRPIARAGLPDEIAVTCRTGWVETRFVDVLSG